MTDNTVRPAEEEWGWVGRRLGEEGGCLTFVHGVGVEHLLTAYGMDIAAATMVTLDQALGGYPERQVGGEPVPWVRVGVSGDWTFAVETDSFLGSTSVVGPASEGTRRPSSTGRRNRTIGSRTTRTGPVSSSSSRGWSGAWAAVIPAVSSHSCGSSGFWSDRRHRHGCLPARETSKPSAASTATPPSKGSAS